MRRGAVCPALRVAAQVALMLVCSGCGYAGVKIALNDRGLTSLTYGGTEFLANGQFGPGHVVMRDSSGKSFKADLTGKTTVDQEARAVLLDYSWGSVRVGFAASGNRLTITVTTTNTSPNTITGVFYEPMTLRFPSAVREFKGSIPLICSNVGDPCLVNMTFSSGTLVLANEDVTKPLILGFPWTLDKPANKVFPLRVNTSRDDMYPDRVPFVNRPIAPGGKDVYRFSLRFGARGATEASLAGDIYSRFRTAFPAQLQWPDRRAIGSIFLASTAVASRTNPRGWFNDPAIDVSAVAGVAGFRNRILQFADSSIAILRKMNAQGMITWDIEGQQFPQATTYIGDPRLLSRLAPEMDGVADAYFRRFTDAGFRVGLCLRPQQLTISRDGGSARQDAVADPTRLLIDKIAYAKKRWGATLFYIDSNGDPALPMDADVFRRVAAAVPGILLIPEHKNTLYYAFTAPYAELRGGVTSTPNRVRSVYPAAFTVLNTADGPIRQNYSALLTAVSRGDSLMYRTWWSDPANAQIEALYNAIARSPVAARY